MSTRWQKMFQPRVARGVEEPGHWIQTTRSEPDCRHNEAAPAFLTARGEMAALMRVRLERHTAGTGAENWPQSLRTAVDIILSSRYAMFVWWGGTLTNLYNDAYRPFLGKKHPEALGLSASDVWAEIWDQIGPRTVAVLGTRRDRPSTRALLLPMDRHGYLEETYFSSLYTVRSATTPEG